MILYTKMRVPESSKPENSDGANPKWDTLLAGVNTNPEVLPKASTAQPSHSPNTTDRKPYLPADAFTTLGLHDGRVTPPSQPSSDSYPEAKASSKPSLLVWTGSLLSLAGIAIASMFTPVTPHPNQNRPLEEPQDYHPPSLEEMGLSVPQTNTETPTLPLPDTFRRPKPTQLEASQTSDPETPKQMGLLKTVVNRAQDLLDKLRLG